MAPLHHLEQEVDMRKLVILMALCSLIVAGVGHAEDITATGMSQGALFNWMTEVNSRLNAITKGSVTLSGALAIGTDNTTIRNTATITGVVNGVVFTKAATDNIAMTAGTEQAISTFAKYAVCVNSSGTVATVQGNSAATAAAALLPACASGYIPVGAVQIATDNATTFTAGTSDLSASGITDTYFNFIGPVMGGETAEIGMTGW